MIVPNPLIILISSLLGGAVAAAVSPASRARRAFLLGLLSGPLVMWGGKYAGDRALGWTESEERLAAINQANAGLYQKLREDMIAAAEEWGRQQSEFDANRTVREQAGRAAMREREAEWERLVTLRDDLAIQALRQGHDPRTAVVRANKELTKQWEIELDLLKKEEQTSAVKERIKLLDLKLWQLQQRLEVPSITGPAK